MSDLVLAGAGVALLTLMFSDYPFIQVVYFLAIQTVIDWSQWTVVTGIMLIAMMGTGIAKRLRS